MTRSLIATALLSLALTAPGAASAGLVTWELEGTIEAASLYTVHGGFVELHAEELIPQLEAAGLVSGAHWSARLTFDTDTPVDCTDCDVPFAAFIGATKSIEFLAGSFSATSPSGATGNAGLGNDSYFQSAVGNDSTTLFAISAAAILTSMDGETLFATSLPTNPPDLDDLLAPTQLANGLFYGTRFNVVGRGLVRNSDMAIFLGGPRLVSQSFAIDGRITSITPVPEPTVLTLALAAAAALALRRRF